MNENIYDDFTYKFWQWVIFSWSYGVLYQSQSLRYHWVLWSEPYSLLTYQLRQKQWLTQARTLICAQSSLSRLSSIQRIICDISEEALNEQLLDRLLDQPQAVLEHLCCYLKRSISLKEGRSSLCGIQALEMYWQMFTAYKPEEIALLLSGVPQEKWCIMVVRNKQLCVDRAMGALRKYPHVTNNAHQWGMVQSVLYLSKKDIAESVKAIELLCATRCLDIITAQHCLLILQKSDYAKDFYKMLYMLVLMGRTSQLCCDVVTPLLVEPKKLAPLNSLLKICHQQNRGHLLHRKNLIKIAQSSLSKLEDKARLCEYQALSFKDFLKDTDVQQETLIFEQPLSALTKRKVRIRG